MSPSGLPLVVGAAAGAGAAGLLASLLVPMNWLATNANTTGATIGNTFAPIAPMSDLLSAVADRCAA